MTLNFERVSLILIFFCGKSTFLHSTQTLTSLLHIKVSTSTLINVIPFNYLKVNNITSYLLNLSLVNSFQTIDNEALNNTKTE